MRWLAALGGALLAVALLRLRLAAALAATAGAGLVIVRIADHAGPDGFGACPSTRRPPPALAGAPIAAAAGWASWRRGS